MIPGFPANTSYRRIADEVWGIPMCASQKGCPKGLGYLAHRHGRTDRTGMVHWTNADKRASRPGCRNLVKLIAMSYNGHWRAEPVWMRLYLTNVWAYKEILTKLHFKVRSSWSRSDKQQTVVLANKKGRLLHTDYRNFYEWVKR